MSERPPSANIPTLTEVVSRPLVPARPGAPVPAAAAPVNPAPRAGEATAKNPAGPPIAASPARAPVSSAVSFESTAVLEGDQVIPAPAGRPAPAATDPASATTAPAPLTTTASAPPAVASAPLAQPAVGSSAAGAANDGRRSAVKSAPGRPPEPAASASPPSAAMSSSATPSPLPSPVAAAQPRALRPSAPAPAAAALLPAASEGELVDRVLAHLQRQVDLALEVKLREVLTPLLTRASDNVVREAKRELTTVMRELVSRAISQELARRGKLP